jgi:hypothetical protein
MTHPLPQVAQSLRIDFNETLTHPLPQVVQSLRIDFNETLTHPLPQVVLTGSKTRWVSSLKVESNETMTHPLPQVVLTGGRALGGFSSLKIDFVETLTHPVPQVVLTGSRTSNLSPTTWAACYSDALEKIFKELSRLCPKSRLGNRSSLAAPSVLIGHLILTRFQPGD